MILRSLVLPLLPKAKPALLNSQVYPFIIMKIFKKRFGKETQNNSHQKAQTYRPSSQQQSKGQQKQKTKVDDNDDPEYDFFSRQKQIQLNKDFRKIREQIQFIPQDVGKGGFDQVVYWSQFAKTPQQIIQIVEVFNRAIIPDEIADKFRLQEFIEKAKKTVYLSSNLHQLQEFATFGQKYFINDSFYWKKIEQKTIRLNPQTSLQINDAIQIAFIMSKMGQGQLIFSSLSNIFKNIKLSPQDEAKLLLIYSNTESGDKEWVQKLSHDLTDSIHLLPKKLFVEMFPVFKKMKNFDSNQQSKVIQNIGQKIHEFTFKELCLAAGYVEHGKMNPQFWQKIQKRLIEVMPKTKSPQNTLYLMEILSSYSISVELVRQNLLPLLRYNNFGFLSFYPPQILSSVSKILYIYELQKQTQDIEEHIETIIMRTFNNLKNVEIQSLIKVIKDYSVTRVGSRELYIFLEEVAAALFEEIIKNREHSTALYAIYEQSNLCSPEFLKKLQYYL